jgi:hypothetical protein
MWKPLIFAKMDEGVQISSCDFAGCCIGSLEQFEYHVSVLVIVTVQVTVPPLLPLLATLRVIWYRRKREVRKGAWLIGVSKDVGRGSRRISVHPMQIS